MKEKKRILVVEDNKEIRELLKEFLSKEGYEIYCSGDSLEALEWTHKNRLPNLVITELILPRLEGRGMNGLELTTRFKNWAPHIPVIITTGRTDLISENNPANMVLQKPFSILNELIPEIKKLI